MTGVQTCALPISRAARSAGARHILTAHTRDDQAETLLMRLLRGSGIAGLSAMARETNRDGLTLARPLLSIPKSRLVATLNRAKLDLQFTEIRAPIAGRMSRHLVSLGNLVNANDTVLSNIVSMDPIDFYFDVDERTFLTLMQQVREGKLESGKDQVIPVYLGLTTDQGYPHKGTIDFV